MTKDELSEMRKRADAATPGPWHTGQEYEQSIRGNYIGSVTTNAIVCAEQDGTDCVLATEDAVFIAAARTDVPSLIAEVERCWAEIERLRALCMDELTSEGQKMGGY